MRIYTHCLIHWLPETFRRIFQKVVQYITIRGTKMHRNTAKSQCYHITAAKLAIGMKDAAPRRQINLTQLRKNKRKKIDKTSGRKRPRTDDVDVIPAGDIDQDELQDLMDEVIQSSNPEPASQQEPEQESADDEVIDMDICHKCRKVTPPETKNKIINWIGCDRCPRWFHKFCVGIRANKKLEHYICNMC